MKIPAETESCKMFVQGKDRKTDRFCSKWSRNRS